jgi:hypothetical protein
MCVYVCICVCVYVCVCVCVYVCVCVFVYVCIETNEACKKRVWDRRICIEYIGVVSVVS